MIRHLRTCSVLTALVLTAAIPPALADGKLRGTTRDGEGSPMAGVTIKLLPTDANPDLPAVSIQTNAKGEFLFGVIRPGVYRLAAFADGLRISRLDAHVWVPDNPNVWKYDGEVRSGTEMPPVQVTGLTDGEIHFTMTPSLTGPGPYGTGEKVSTAEAIIAAMQRGETDKAIAELDIALADKPDSPDYNYLYAFATLSAGRNDDALAAIEKTLASEPDYEGARLLKGKILEARGETEAAFDLFRAEGESAPSEQVRRDAYLALGVGLANAGRDEEAAAAFESLIEVADDPIAVYRELHTIYLKTGQKEKAEAVLAKIEESGAPQDPALLYNMGAERLNAGDHEAAAEFFRKAIAGKPDLADAHFRLGQASLNLGDTAAAVESFRKYLELDPEGEHAELAGQLVQALSE